MGEGLSDEIVHAHAPLGQAASHAGGLIVHYVDYLDTDALLFDAGPPLASQKRW